MATTAQMYDEITRILRVTRNNVEHEAERNNSQLLSDVAVTIDNIATLVQNISTEIKTAQEEESDAFVIACAYIINRGLSNDFTTFLREKVATSSERYNHEFYNNAYNLFIERFTKRV
jgi:hypothetical protein